MLFLTLFVAIVILGLCVTEGKSRKNFIAVITAILYFPIGVILTLTKKYK